MNVSRPLLLALAVAASCVDAFVDLPVGPYAGEVALPVASVPAALLDGANALRRVPCADASACPQTGVADLTLRCLGGVCALPTFALDVTTQDIDLTMYSVYRDYVSALRDITLHEARVEVTGAQVGHSVGPLELTWLGPASAPGVERPFGRAPSVSLRERTVVVRVPADEQGVRELVQRFLRGETRFRVRVRGPLDPGTGALPAPRVHVSVSLLLHMQVST